MREQDSEGEWGRVKEALRRERARVLVAPDKFKGTLEAGEVAEVMAAAVRRFNPSAQVRMAPLADGGEGTAAAMARLMGLRPRVFEGHDALMRPCRVVYYTGGEEVCAVDAAAFVGLTMMGEEREPWRLTSWPVGEFVGATLELGYGKVCVAVGGTATVDGGAGMLQALGYRFYDRGGRLMPVPLLPWMLCEIGRVEAPEKWAPKGRLVALVDVDVPLVPGGIEDDSEGETDGGAGEMSSLSFARQKGMRESDMEALAAGLRRYASAVPKTDASAPGQGAGGGIGFALGAVAGAEVRMGAASLMDMARLFDEPYDLVVTGEGAFDSQSLEGKLTGTLIARACRAGTPVLVVAGVADRETGNGKCAEDVAVLTTTPFLPADAPLTHASALASLESALEKFF